MRRRLHLRTRFVVLTVVGFLLAGVAGAGAYFLPVVTTALNVTSQQIARTTAAPPAAATGSALTPAATADSAGVSVTAGRPFTILLLGSDTGQRVQEGEALTQSMILVRVDPASRHVTMLSIPRDLYVPLSNGATDKIDKAYLGGGASAAVATVESNFRVHVDHYAWIGLQGLIQVIDLAGGVDVVTTNPVLDDEYPTDLGGSNPYGATRIALLPGAQHLDGAHALEYVRSRHDDLRGDFGRSARQQQVLLALRAKSGLFGAADLPDLAAAMSHQLKTDLSVLDMRALLPLVSGVDPGNIERIVLLPPATYSATVGSQEVVEPNWSVIRPIVARAFPAS